MDDFSRNTINIFDKLTDNEFLEVKNIFHFKKYRKGDFIIKESDNVQNVYFISSGLVKLSHFDKEAKEAVRILY